MLQRLIHTYQEMTNQTLQGAGWLELGLAQKLDVVSNPVNLLIRSSHQSERLLEPGTSILTVFEEAKQELLILGEPGAGKSTLLLVLAQQILSNAEKDDTCPLPIILPLSSWMLKRQPLQDWLSEQTASIYIIPLQFAMQLVEEKQILPLLDDLNAMDTTARHECITAINLYHKEYLTPLVVCSRTIEYEEVAVTELLSLHSAVTVQPLTYEQVERLLVSKGKSLAGLRRALKKKPILQEILNTPLMLNIAVSTYKDISVQNFLKKEAQLQQQLFYDYVERMIKQKGNEDQYYLVNRMKWLRWLAQQLRTRNQTIFILEQIQPDLLLKNQRISCQWTSVSIIGLAIGDIIGLVNWLLGNLISGLSIGLASTLIFGFLFGRKTNWGTTIHISEAFTWSRKRTQLGLLIGLPSGSFIGLIGGLIPGLAGKLVERLMFGLIVGFVMGIIAGLLFGFSTKQLTKKRHPLPNEGVQRSTMNGLALWLVGGLICGFMFLLANGLLTGQAMSIETLLVALAEGLAVGSVIGMFFGLADSIQHYILRIWLWRTKTLPWDIIHFLDDAASRNLMKKMGSGYSFTHSLLLEYFADLDLHISLSTVPPSSP